MSRPTSTRTFASALRRFRRDEGGASAVEFAIVAGPFIFLLLCILQVGIYYMAQSALDKAVILTADDLRNTFTAAAVPVPPSVATLKSTIVTNAGGLVRNNTNLRVEIEQLDELKTGANQYAIPSNTIDFGNSNTDALALRARTRVAMFIPGLTQLLWVQSSAIVRRQGR